MLNIFIMLPFVNPSIVWLTVMSKPGEKGIKRIISAFHYSCNGMQACWKMEAAFRQELTACIFLVPSAIYFAKSSIELSLMLGSCLIVLIVELLNSGIEAVVDRISPENHELSGLAKDLGSAAVLLSIANLILIWSLIIFT